MNIIKKLEKIKKIKKNKKYLKILNVNSGDFIILWYINRDLKKGLIKYQFIKGICISVKKKGYNSKIIIRNVINRIPIEYNFFANTLNTIYILIKKNKIKYYNSNKLYLFRKQKNTKSKFNIKYNIKQVV